MEKIDETKDKCHNLKYVCEPYPSQGKKLFSHKKIFFKDGHFMIK